jgi:hypothetical protein
MLANIIRSELEKVSVEIVKKTLIECGKIYDFDGKEAFQRLYLADEIVDLKSKKEKKEKSVSSSLLLPYNGECNEKCCNGLKQNHGLYTQCENEKQSSSEFCFGCKKEAIKNENGKPNYGTIQDRQQVGFMEFRDPKGKAPTHYTKIMKKMNYTKEQVLEEAAKQNKRLDDIHLDDIEVKKGRPKTKNEKKEEKSEAAATEEKKKGRPKKTKKPVEEEEVKKDLFAELIMSSSKSEENIEEEKKETKPEKETKTEKKNKKVSSTKAKKSKNTNKEVVESKTFEEEVIIQEQEEELEEEEETDIVKKIVYEGKQYLKSKKTGIIYNLEEEVIGKWNEDSQQIDLIEEEEEE